MLPHAPQDAVDPEAVSICDLAVGRLVDQLGNRLGPERVGRLLPHASHVPERAARRVSALSFDAGRSGQAPDWRAEIYRRFGRPISLLPCDEPIEVVAAVPEGPPRQFRWRKVVYQVSRAEGPERVAPEWWRVLLPLRTRDYYRLEDASGRRFWVYRDGLYGRETSAPQWYVQGFFA